MANSYGPYQTLNTSGVNLKESYAPPSTTNYPYTPAPPFAVGQIVLGTDNSSWVFCIANGALAAGDVVQLSSVFVATGITTSNALFGSAVAVVPYAVADTYYFWAQRSGQAAAIAASTGVLANVQLYTTSTAGRLSSSSTTSIVGIILNATAASNLAAGRLNSPTVGA